MDESNLMHGLNPMRVQYMINAAEQSRFNAKHWLRYLRKQVRDEEVLLTPVEIESIVDSGALTMYQVISLKRAMEKGTPTNQYVVSLNQPSETPMLDQILRKYHNA